MLSILCEIWKILRECDVEWLNINNNHLFINMVDIAILGGGLAGVAFALELKYCFPSAEIVVLEKSESFGGLLKSVSINNHIFDTGGSHIIFSKNKILLRKILSFLNNNFVNHQRSAKVLLDSTFVPYPLENGLYVLPPEERAEALINFLEAWISRDVSWMPETFRDWIYGFFGKWIAEKYLAPYNEKIWKRPLNEIDVDWIYTPGRVPMPDWKDIVRSAIGIPTVGYIEQSIFYYPRFGGIQALFDSIAKKAGKLGIKFLRNFVIFRIKKSNDEWTINDNIKAKRLICTIPIRELVNVLNAPENVIKAAERLDYNRLVVIGIALKKNAPKQHWVYVPNINILFHRYAWISNYSPENSPKGESTILAETTLPPNTKVNIEELTNKVITDFEKLNVFKRNEVLLTRVWVHEYGYPIHKIGYKKIRETIMLWLREQNIVSAGRWGSWQYWNMDKVYEDIIDKLKKIK
ncbi:MAG: FAD-dependent oxidoreductase [Candidatus Bathyarchaeia archaeon]